MGRTIDNANDKREVRVELDLPARVHDHLRYLGRVQGESVPKVVRQMIDNGIRARKASDPDFKAYARRHN